MSNDNEESQPATTPTGNTAANDIHNAQPEPPDPPQVTPIEDQDAVDQAQKIADNVQDALGGLVTPPGVPGNVLTGRRGKKKP